MGDDDNTPDRGASAEFAEMRRSGRVERALLVPAEFGGTDDARNVVYLPPAAAQEKRRIDGEVAGWIERGARVRYRAVPHYERGAVVPVTVALTAESVETRLAHTVDVNRAAPDDEATVRDPLPAAEVALGSFDA